MAHYFVGDIQGCYLELVQLLEQVNFDKSKDVLLPVGDLVARGSDSLSTAKLMLSLGDAVQPVLGNHDLHFIAVYHGLRKAKRKDYLDDLLAWSELDDYIEWLRKQPLVRTITMHEKLHVISHAGWYPAWSLSELLEQAKAAEKILAGKSYKKWLPTMYGDEPKVWSKKHNKEDAFRFTVSALTRMRYLDSNLALDFLEKNPPAQASSHLNPWFDYQNEEMKGHQIIFGHWASLLGQTQHANVIALDTGCVWGNDLTMYRLEDGKYFKVSSTN
ncbi:symmetrical bis(5'-nucleosyl)-tetraphosphatase [Catenovulum sp. SM1970]|uniref:symmetrical bis(5'-nucleosyl)-tetraphosphatase n=1 Tax=Marinifaba aquimaris TaxID=2741323 RepID=UPI00157174F5|nr:symmetrical bis(5'-nucleosyl)-tetraphosphatase [Marinifaba aquimaris]NTS77451.1 symmetrical bis(5'-nucleosyl)-tetraphosphatase [Marinifaba aquimaris]